MLLRRHWVKLIKATGWELRFANQVNETAAPTLTEFATLRDFFARTPGAHGDNL